MPKKTPEQPRLISEPGSEYKITPEEQARKDEYRQRLREYLSDPEFRNIPGFPVGDDDAILELSDPPYYTACPNPFLPEIIEEWQNERIEIRKEMGLPDDSVEKRIYQREPFAADVSEGKNNPIYNAHSYHTKVPHPAIMRYILHYTEPGDVIFDGFCGTGMAGVAAQLCGEHNEVEKLGYHVDGKGWIYDSPKDKNPISRLGARKAILSDLSTVATFIAYNYNTPIDINEFEQEARRILNEVNDEYGWMYETWHPDCKDPNRIKGEIKHVVWSETFICPECGQEISFWDSAIDKKLGAVKDKFKCVGCGVELSKKDLDKAWFSYYDSALSMVVNQTKYQPVFINYTASGKSFEKKVDEEDRKILQLINELEISEWYPRIKLPEGEKTKDPIKMGITHVHHFYTRRNLQTLAAFYNKLSNFSIKLPATFMMTGSMPDLMKRARLRIGAYFHGGRGSVSGGQTGNLYVPSMSVEKRVTFGLENRLKTLCQVLPFQEISNKNYAITTQSSSKIYLMDDTIDYIFVDPPFGSNFMYSELNSIWEAWLSVMTNTEAEAIINKTQKKKLPEYKNLMEICFLEFYRVLKPNRWITIEFSNTKNSVWNAIQEALLKAGFVIADVRTFDKKQGTFNQVMATGAMKEDLIISAYKPNKKFELLFRNHGGKLEGIWEFIRQHLEHLPVVVHKNGTIESIAERQSYLLFNRMVAYHIQRGVSVPLSAAQFFAGLEERFPKRDGMYFLPEQVHEYDQARLEADSVAQLTFVVSDEKTAIQWLRQQFDPQLGGTPQTRQEIQSKFLLQLHQAQHEVMPELSDLLEQNFLQDDASRWYVPNPNKISDLEKVRNKALLREFSQYLEGKGGLKQFRTEAIRAGFTDAWHHKDFGRIIKVANRLPDTVLQEDPDLLMYYDNASLRVD